MTTWMARAAACLLLTIPLTASAQSRPTASREPSLRVLVTTRAGDPIEGASVQVEGHVSRDGTTAADGTVSFGLMTPGPYRCRIEREGYVTLEKDVDVGNSGRTSVEASLSTASAATAAPAPAAPAALEPGEPTIMDVTDLAAEELRARDDLVDRLIGCSGAASARLLRLKQDLPPRISDDADQVVYVVAGEATLTIGTLNKNVSAGSLGIVPRGTGYAVSPRGRNPLILLTVTSGPGCMQLAVSR
jgi:mannose-6-phosphate isomerase-like protein (cupin superfamily)